MDTVRRIEEPKNRRTKRRRDFLVAAGTTAASLSLLPIARGNEDKQATLGKAEHCIFVWLGGGAGQIDTWDPKQLGDPQAKKPGSYYKAVDTAIPSVQVCEHLAQC